jgi:hypothetical protein
LQVEALAVHPHGDVADAGPCVEPRAHQSQLRRGVRHEHGGERGADAAAAGRHHFGGYAVLNGLLMNPAGGWNSEPRTVRC